MSLFNVVLVQLYVSKLAVFHLVCNVSHMNFSPSYLILVQIYVSMVAVSSVCLQCGVAYEFSPSSLILVQLYVSMVAVSYLCLQCGVAH